MRLSNKQIVESLPGLQLLATKDLPVNPSFKIGVAIRHVFDAHADFEKARLKLVEKHREKDAEGKPIEAKEGGLVKLSDPDAFNKEFDELLSMESDIQVPELIHLKDFGEIKLPPNVFASLQWLVQP